MLVTVSADIILAVNNVAEAGVIVLSLRKLSISLVLNLPTPPQLSSSSACFHLLSSSLTIFSVLLHLCMCFPFSML